MEKHKDFMVWARQQHRLRTLCFYTFLLFGVCHRMGRNRRLDLLPGREQQTKEQLSFTVPGFGKFFPAVANSFGLSDTLYVTHK